MSIPPHSPYSDYAVAQRRAIEKCSETISRIRAFASPESYRQHVRFATLRNQLYRIALQCDLQLGDTGPILPPGLSSSGGIAWRLSADCFSVVISAIPADGYSLPPGTTPPEDYPVSVAAVHFEFNQDKPTECSALAEDLKKRNYDSLLNHVKNLTDLYDLPGEIAQRCRAYLCLQALEQDLVILTTAARYRASNSSTPVSLETTGTSCNVASTQSNVFSLAQSINNSAVGQVTPRTGGAFAVLTYFVSAAQTAIIMSRASKLSVRIGPQSGMLGGFCASVGLRATANRVQYSLPLVSLVNLIKDADGYNIAQFTNADNITRVNIAAEFFLELHPPLLLDVESISKIEEITKVQMDNLQNCEPLPLHYLLLRQHNQEGLSLVDVHMALPNKMQHAYHVVPNNLCGYVVSTIAFTCPSQLPPLIQLLRRKAAWLSFVESFLLHPRNPAVKDEELTYRFYVDFVSESDILVGFQHPLCNRRHVQVSIRMSDLGVLEAKVLGAALPEGFRFDSEKAEVTMNCGKDDCNPTEILKCSHNLPVSLTWLLLQLGCPVAKMLTSMFPKKVAISINSYKNTESSDRRQPAVCLGLARTTVYLSNDASADGLLAGSDKLSESTLLEAKRLFLGDGFEGSTGVLYNPTAGATPSWPVLQHAQFLSPPTSSQPLPSRPLLPLGVMVTTSSVGLTSDRLSVPTPKSIDDTFSSCASTSDIQTFRSVPMIPGVMTTAATSSLFVQPTAKPSISYPTVSAPSTLAFKLQNPVACGGSMLVSLLDEDNPSPHVVPSALPSNRILSSPVTAITPSTIIAQMLNNNHSTPLTTTSTYFKSSSSSDVLSHLDVTSNIGASVSSIIMGASSSANSSTQALSSTLKSVTTSETIPSKKGRKRRVDSTMGAIISTLPTRAAIMNSMKQPAKQTPSKPAVLPKVSIYDFEDCPSSTNISPPPKPFAFADASAPERTAERKSGLKFVIKTNRGGFGGSLTAAATNPTENAAVVTKPRTKAVEGKPFALFKQMQHQKQPSTSSQHPKKERKRHVSSKVKEAQPSLVLSISSPKVLSTTSMAPPIPSPKKHGPVKNKPGRKKALSSSSEAKRHRLMSSDEPLIESGALAPCSGVSSGGGNGTNRLIKGYKIPKVRKLPLSPFNKSPPVASLSANQEEVVVVRNEMAPTPIVAQCVSVPTPLPSSLLPPPSTSNTISPTITKLQQRSLLYIVENLKRAVVESGIAPHSHHQQTSSATVVELARNAVDGPGEDTLNTPDDSLAADLNDNLFEKFSGSSTPTKEVIPSMVHPPSKRFKSGPMLGTSGYDLKDKSCNSRRLEDETASTVRDSATSEVQQEDDENVAAVPSLQDAHSVSQTQPGSLDENFTATGEYIKAPTDTPDSPTESLTTKTFVASSKIIPVSQDPVPPLPPNSHTSALAAGTAASAGGASSSSSSLFNKPISGRPASTTSRGGMAWGAAGPRLNYLRGGWGNRPYGSPMLPRGASGSGGAGRLPLPPWGVGPGGPPQPPPGGGGWGPPRGSGPLHRVSGGGGGNRQALPKK